MLSRAKPRTSRGVRGFHINGVLLRSLLVWLQGGHARSGVSSASTRVDLENTRHASARLRHFSLRELSRICRRGAYPTLPPPPEASMRGPLPVARPRAR